jgi:glycosyl transferase family 11
MILVKLTGGLGNQMFQYAVGRKLAIQFNTKLIFDNSFFENHKFCKFGLSQYNISQRIITPGEQIIFDLKPAKTLLSKLYYKVLRSILEPMVITEKQFNFDSGIFSKAKNNLYLKGYWQTEKYFSDIKTVLISDFTLKNPPEQKNKEASDRIKSANSVSLHVRRGDYLKPENHYFQNICGQEYYAKAIDYISKEVTSPVFFIFSDDMHWARENIKTSFETVFIDFNNTENHWEDMRLMSLCKHNIIANSSFSWWGAWLNTNANKIVIAPKQWFNYTEQNYSDVVPDNWVKID